MCTRAALTMFSGDDVEDAAGELEAGEPARRLERREGRVRRVPAKGHAAPGEGLRVEVAEDEVRVRDRRVPASPAVAGGPGLGARALGPDLEQTQLVHPGDAPAARADLDELQGRDPQRKPAPRDEAALPAGLEGVGDEGLAAVHEAKLGRRPSHVEGEEVAVSGPRPEPRGRDRPRGRTGLEHPHREAPRLVDVGEPSTRQHEEEAAPDPCAATRSPSRST